MKKAVALALVAAGAALGAWLAWPHGSSAKTLAPIPFGLTRPHGISRYTIELGPAPKPQPRMSALRRARTVDDALPAAAVPRLALVGQVPGNDMTLATQNRAARAGPGAVKTSESHLLFRSGDSRLYGVPTTHGWVCFVLAPELLSQCAPRFADGLVWLSLEQTQTRTIATGIVPDRVRQVSLAVGKERHVATLARNGFLDELPGAAADELDAVIVTTKDGSTFRLPLDRRIFQP